MVVPGWARCSTAMCFLSWRAYGWSGTGSDEAIRLVAAGASVKLVTCSVVDGLREADSLARAAHSAPYASLVVSHVSFYTNRGGPSVLPAYARALSGLRPIAVGTLRPRETNELSNTLVNRPQCHSTVCGVLK